MANQNKKIDRKSSGKKKDAVVGTSRGIETMLRGAYRSQLEMTTLADNKANILITINALILTITFASGGLIGRLNLLMMVPASVFLVSCLASMTFAILAVRPRLMQFDIKPKDIRKEKASILFFGSLDGLSAAEYEELMTEVMSDQSKVYRHMIGHLYGLGKVLNRKFRLLRHAYTTLLYGLTIAIVMFIITSLILELNEQEPTTMTNFAGRGEGMAQLEGIAYPRFKSVYEPSAVTQIGEGIVLAVEDEEVQPLDILKFDRDSNSFTETAISPKEMFQVGGEYDEFRELNDLEGLDVDDQGFIYAVTSHSRSTSGRNPDREKLVRFTVLGDRISQPSVYKDLKDELTAKFDVLKEAAAVIDVKTGNGFNIEGLSFNATKDLMLVGFRGPIIDGKAMIVQLENVPDLFDTGAKLRVSDNAIFLRLGGQGIRGMNYDSRLGGYLIISGPAKKNEEPFYLWFWDGDSSHEPQRISVEGVRDFERAEGITQITYGGEDRIMIAYDDGDRRSRNPARYLLLSYDELTVNRQLLTLGPSKK